MALSVADPVNDNDPDPYRRGIEDFARGVSRHMNPFDETDYGTTLWEAWFDGWDDASDETRGGDVNNRLTLSLVPCREFGKMLDSEFEWLDVDFASS